MRRYIRRLIGLKLRIEAILLEKSMAMYLGWHFVAAAVMSDLITVIRRWWNHKREIRK